MTNLDPKNNYYIAVTAYDRENFESDFSNEVRWPYLDLIDFEGDSMSDLSVYRANNGAWYIRPSSGASPYGIGWNGNPSNKSVSADYDGAGRTDIVVYRATIGAWNILPSGEGASYGMGWGGNSTDIPMTLTLSSIY